MAMGGQEDARGTWTKERNSDTSAKLLPAGALSVKQLTEQGQKEFSCGNYASAVGIFSAAINLDQGNSNLYAMRSAAWAKKGDLEKALEDARMTAHLNSTRRASVFGMCWGGGNRHVMAVELESLSDNSPLSVNSNKDETGSVHIHDVEVEKEKKWQRAGCRIRNLLRFLSLRKLKRDPEMHRTLEGFDEAMADNDAEERRREEELRKSEEEQRLKEEEALDEEIFSCTRRRRSLSSLCSIPEEELL